MPLMFDLHVIFVSPQNTGAGEVEQAEEGDRSVGDQVLQVGSAVILRTNGLPETVLFDQGTDATLLQEANRRAGHILNRQIGQNKRNLVNFLPLNKN